MVVALVTFPFDVGARLGAALVGLRASARAWARARRARRSPAYSGEPTAAQPAALGFTGRR